MNRRKPGRPTHRRENTTDHTTNRNGYRITGRWPASNRPAIESTQDRAQAKRHARAMAKAGAHVLVEQHSGHGAWRTLYTLDSAQPAPAPAQPTSGRRTATEDRGAHLRSADRAEAALSRLARLMTEAPVTRSAEGRSAARHVTGSQR